MTDTDPYDHEQQTSHVHPEEMGIVAVDTAFSENPEDHQADFEEWEEELQERKELNERESMREGKIIRFGKFSDIAGSGKWYGGISPLDRIRKGELTEERIDRAIAPEYVDEPNNFSRFFIKVVRGAKVRCIDGRGKLGYKPGVPEMYGEELGPQVAGGTPGQAIAYRVAEGGTAEQYAASDVEDDIEHLAGMADQLGYVPGGHVDDHSPLFDQFEQFRAMSEKKGVHLDISAQDFLQMSIDQLSAEGKTGCGAVDGIVADIERVTDPEDIDSIESLVKVILDQAGLYNQDHFDGIIASSIKLKSAKSYFARKASAIKKLVARKRDSVTVLHGTHNEVLLNINYVEGTTFHTSEFSARNDDDIQAFNYDIWHTFEIAHRLYPEDSAKASRYIHARTALAVATAKRLMGDSVELSFRIANDQQDDTQRADELVAA